MNYVVKNYGLDKVKILSDRANLIRMEEAAKQIVLDSLVRIFRIRIFFYTTKYS